MTTIVNPNILGINNAVDASGADLVKSYNTSQATYSCSVSMAAAASATDIATIYGSASKTVYITKAIVSGIQTTAGTNEIFLIKRSAVNTTGTSTAGTAIPHDSTNAAASATVLAYTANPGGLGTAVGTVRRADIPVVGATSVINPVVVFDFGATGQPIVLRGAAQGLCVNLNGVTVTGGVFDIVFEWFEI